MPPQPASINMKTAEGIHKMVEALRVNTNVKQFLDIYDENAKLLKENETLETTVNVITSKHAKLQKELEAARGESSSRDKELEAERRKRTDLEKGYELTVKEHDTEKKELGRAKNELERLGRFSAKLEPFRTDDIVQRLETISVEARGLAESYFGEEFSANFRSDADLWGNIKKYEVVNDIPLPMTNTLAAKRMRVSAVLAILSIELSNHFVHWHLSDVLGPGGWPGMSVLLSDVAMKHPEQESHLRSVLLQAVMSSAPQQKVAAERIAQATECIYNVLAPPFKAVDREALHEDIHELCETVCKHWQHIQMSRYIVQQSNDFSSGGPSDWMPLRFSKESLTDQQTAVSNQGKSTQNAANPGQSGGSAKKHQGNQGRQQPQTQTDGGDDTLDTVLWPSFYAMIPNRTGTVERVTLAHGFVLCASHDREARDEERSLRRGGSRRQSIWNGSTSGAAGGSRGEMNANSSSFLSSGSGGGQKNG